MKQDVNENQFRNEFKAIRPDNFTYDGLTALWEYSLLPLALISLFNELKKKKKTNPLTPKGDTDMKEKEIAKLKRSHARLLRGCQESLQWIAKVAADQDEGDPTGLATRAMRYHGDVAFAILNAYQAPKEDDGEVTP